LFHDDPLYGGHLGFDKTYGKLKIKYWWEGMYTDCKEWIKSCIICQRKKKSKHDKAPLQPIVPIKPWDMIGVDAIGPLSTTKNGNRYIVVYCDYVTKWSEAFAIPKLDAETCANLLINEIISRFGPPKKLLSDRGTSFLNDLADYVYKIMNIKKLNTSAYRPQTDGLVERFNGTLVSELRAYVDKHGKDWDIYIPFVLNAYRTSPHSTTKFSPYYLLFGREPETTLDTMHSNISKELMKMDTKKVEQLHQSELIENLHEGLKIAQENQEKTIQKYERSFNKKAKEVKFGPGDKVWLYCQQIKKGFSKKFHQYWTGPFEVIEISNIVNARLKNLITNRNLPELIHVNHLKPYIERTKYPEEQPEEPQEFNLKTMKEIRINELIGKNIKIYWSKYKKYFKGKVMSYDNKRKKIQHLLSG